ncbi:Serine carboxypeptidase-like 45 [Camellia lanceoleosa]|uniref:Serine carboxypeptidase-like 45 n=1 Tax=Camellia lanceoleosa TaxID=1840588 RepID=A0ACC0HJC5_9ERIC|nr:Serine carboxypeptidase-like 45 [Camellia lanceoleosa]
MVYIKNSYSGDQDSVVPLLGSRTLVNGLAKKLGLNTTVPYRVWFEGKQVAGWTQVYVDILYFATIRGASHEAPFSQPERSLVLFNAFFGWKTTIGEFSQLSNSVQASSEIVLNKKI